MNFQIGDRVTVNGLDGTVGNIRRDERGEFIFTVSLDNQSATPTGYYLARDVELRRLENEGPVSKPGELGSRWWKRGSIL